MKGINDCDGLRAPGLTRVCVEEEDEGACLLDTKFVDGEDGEREVDNGHGNGGSGVHYGEESERGEGELGI